MTDHIDLLEFHDSHLLSIEKQGDDLVLRVDGYIHRVDERRVWQVGFWQPLELRLLSGTMEGPMFRLPVDILSAKFASPDTNDELIVTPIDIQEEVGFTISGMDSSEDEEYVTLSFRASGLRSSDAGEPYGHEHHFIGEQF